MFGASAIELYKVSKPPGGPEHICIEGIEMHVSLHYLLRQFPFAPQQQIDSRLVKEKIDFSRHLATHSISMHCINYEYDERHYQKKPRHTSVSTSGITTNITKDASSWQAPFYVLLLGEPNAA